MPAAEEVITIDDLNRGLRVIQNRKGDQLRGDDPKVLSLLNGVSSAQNYQAKGKFGRKLSTSVEPVDVEANFGSGKRHVLERLKKFIVVLDLDGEHHLRIRTDQIAEQKTFWLFSRYGVDDQYILAFDTSSLSSSSLHDGIVFVRDADGPTWSYRSCEFLFCCAATVYSEADFEKAHFTI